MCTLYIVVDSVKNLTIYNECLGGLTETKMARPMSGIIDTSRIVMDSGRLFHHFPRFLFIQNIKIRFNRKRLTNSVIKVRLIPFVISRKFTIDKAVNTFGERRKLLHVISTIQAAQKR